MRKPSKNGTPTRDGAKTDAPAGAGLGEAWTVERLGFLGLGSVSAFSAKVFGASGSDRNRLSKIFRGERRISVDDVRALADALNVSGEEVLHAFAVGTVAPLAAMRGDVDASGAVTLRDGVAVPAPCDAHAGVRVWAALRFVAGPFDGAAAYYDEQPRMLGGLQGVAGKLAYVIEETGAGAVCRVVSAEAGDKLHVTGLDGKRRQTTRVKFASPVLWMRT